MSSPADYSYLIQTVEGDIVKGLEDSSGSNSRKRLKTNENDIINYTPLSDVLYKSSSNATDVIYYSPDINVTSSLCRQRYNNSITSIRESVENHELNIFIEKLQDQLNNARNDMKLLKECDERQLFFLETENVRLKKLSEEKSNKYYDEKKKWQAKLRILEAENIALKQNKIKIMSNTNTSTPISSATSSTTNNNCLLNHMENTINDKSNEIKNLTIKNIELHSHLKKLEQDILLFNANISTDSTNLEEVSELRKRCSDLESKLRRKSRECERLEQKLINQQLMEDQIVALKSKLKASHINTDQLQELEASCQALTKEKQQWVTVFEGMQVNDKVETGTDCSETSIVASFLNIKYDSNLQNVNPVAILRTLSSTQKRCALLLKSQGELEVTIAEQRIKISNATSISRELERKYEDAVFQIETFESNLALAQQRIRLFEGEVTSLRVILESLILEFQIGNPDVSSILKSKDNIIKTLRQELDDSRNWVKAYALEIETNTKVRDQFIEENNFPEKSQKNDLMSLEIEKYKRDFIALTQVSGMDYLPENTKIVHLIHNPVTHIMGKSLVSSIPKEKINYLCREIKKLNHNYTKSENSDNHMDHAINQDHSMNNSTMLCSADSLKLNRRLKEMFKERISSFREAVYLLTGYKIDLYAATNGCYPRLRLKSMYAEDADDSLLFQWRDNALELMETPFATKLEQKLFDYLSTCNSVPAFLSNVTMELFDNQTFMASR